MRTPIDPLHFQRGTDGVAYAYFECEECCGEGQQMHARLYPSGHTEVWEECETCYGSGEVDEEIIEPTSAWEEFYKA